MNYKIIKIETIREHDDSTTSEDYLGRYSNEDGPYAIDRTQRRGGSRRGEYQFFHPKHENYKGSPEAEIIKYCAQDYRRAEKLNEGKWEYLFVRAQATIHNESSGLTQIIRSGGCGGIESDAKGHIQEIEQEELNALRCELIDLGFNGADFDRVLKGGKQEISKVPPSEFLRKSQTPKGY